MPAGDDPAHASQRRHDPGAPVAAQRSVPPAWANRIVGSDEVPPDQLLANPANWRIHPKPQQRALAGALDHVGWVAQVLVNQRTGHVVDGHLRVELALSRGESSVPVLYVDLSEEEERLVLATLDPLAAMAGAEATQLEALLAGLAVDDAGLREMLDDLARQHGLDGARPGLADPDAIPDVPAEPYVRAGELWALGDHRLLVGDATDPAAVARLLAADAPPLLATDPPYGVRLDPTWRDGVHNALGAAERPYMQLTGGPGAGGAEPAVARRGRTKGHRNTTLSGDTRVDWSEAFALVPSLEVGYVWHAGVHAAAVAQGLASIGFDIVAQVIWDKGLFAMGRSWYHWGHEPCWVIRRPGARVPFLGARNQSTVWRAPSPKMIMAGSTEEKQDHPAQKPVLLSEIPIGNHLRPGGLVYDPFLGSGTTLVAAERLDRRCLGLEVDPRYAQVIIERWQAYTGRQAERIDG